MKYKSELIKEIVETRGHNLSSPHYESECVKSWIEETKEAYPKLCDYESEWLNYIIEKPIGNVSYETVIVNPTATINNVVPYKYKSAILKGNTDENLQSVKMPVLTTTGKNLIDETKLIDGYLTDTNQLNASDAYNKITDYIKIKPNTKYIYQHGGFVVPSDVASNYRTYWTGGYFYDKDKRPIGDRFKYENTLTVELTSPSNAQYVRLGSRFLGVPGAFVQLEESSIATSYESYKSNILTVNEEVELRAIGGVQDELNLLTGELTQHIGEITLDGSDDEGWLRNPQNDGENTVVFYIGDLFKEKSEVIIDRFAPYLGSGNFWLPKQNDSENHLRNNNDLAIRISKSKLTSLEVDGFRQWLSQNPITVQHELKEELVKTVALTPLNKPYKGTNHYHLTANIPCEAILEVPVVSTGKQTIEEINN